MNKTASNLRRQLMLFTACTMASTALAAAPALAQTTTTTPSTDSYKINKIIIQHKKLLLKEKDVPSAVFDVSQKDIEAENPTMGSIQTVLKLAPSVNAYSQGPGQSAPTLEIRGIKNDELAETLDGIPLNDILSGSGDYLSNNVGSYVTLNQIDGVQIFEGVAPTEAQGFGTVGGTIAYTTKQPTDERYAILEGGIGSFDTQHIGFEISTGKLYDDVNAPKMLLQYDQSQTAGYVSNTNAQYHDFMMNIEKPYGPGGTSKVGLVVIFNQGKGAIQTEPTPVAEIEANKWTYNFPKYLGFYNQTGQFLTTILSDSTYINEHLIASGSLFFQHDSTTIDSYASPETVDGSFPYAVNVQAPANFFGDIADFAGPVFTYDPTIFGSSNAGESSEYTVSHGNKVGITPRLDIFYPVDALGMDNTVHIGSVIAKESSGGSQYIYGGTGAQFVQQNGYDGFEFGGGQQRTIYVGYLTDKMDFFNDHLHIQPGFRVDAAYSSNIEQVTYANLDQEKYQNFSKVGEPYLGISYDLPAHFTIYATYGKGALDAPVGDYSAGTSTLNGIPAGTHAPTPEIVHLYEAGVKYDTPEVAVSADYFYQKVDDAFSFFSDYLTNTQYYANTGAFLDRGVEVQAKLKLPEHFTLSANGSYNNTDYLNNYFAFVTIQNDQFGYAYHGTPFSNVPTFLGNLALDYDNGPLSARLSGQFTGRQNQTTDIIEPGCDPNTTAGKAICELPLSGATITDTNNLNPANFITNFLISYKVPVNSHHLQDVTLTLNAQNLTNWHYYTYRYSSEIASQGLYSVLPNYPSGLIGPPRSITFDISAKF